MPRRSTSTFSGWPTISSSREALGRLAPDLLAAILESPNPDGGGGRHRAVRRRSRSGRAMFLDYLREDPRALHVLTYVMGASPQLGDILIRTPEYFHWLVSQVERSAPDRQDHEEELVSAFAAIDDPIEGLNMLRRWKRRETLAHRHARSAAPRNRPDGRPHSCRTWRRSRSILRSPSSCSSGSTPTGARNRRARLPSSARAVSAGARWATAPTSSVLYVYDARSVDGAGATGARDFFERVGCDLTAVLAGRNPRRNPLSRRGCRRGRRPTDGCERARSASTPSVMPRRATMAERASR